MENTTANHVVLANAVAALDGEYLDDAQVFVSASRPELFISSAKVRVELHDAITDVRRNFVVEIREVIECD